MMVRDGKSHSTYGILPHGSYMISTCTVYFVESAYTVYCIISQLTIFRSETLSSFNRSSIQRLTIYYSSIGRFRPERPVRLHRDRGGLIHAHLQRQVRVAELDRLQSRNLTSGSGCRNPGSIDMRWLKRLRGEGSEGGGEKKLKDVIKLSDGHLYRVRLQKLKCPIFYMYFFSTRDFDPPWDLY